MLNIFISLVLGIGCFYFFGYSFLISNVNKTVLNIPISIFEVSIPLSSQEYYFNKDVLEYDVKEYFASSISKSINDYSLTFSYYSTSDYLFCKSMYCDGVNITFSCKVLFHDYKRTMFYEIAVNDEI